MYKFDCHEGEINSVKFHKNGRFFATGGGDRKIKLWEYKDNKCELMNNLIGSNAAIASIDFDCEVNIPILRLKNLSFSQIYVLKCF